MSRGEDGSDGSQDQDFSYVLRQTGPRTKYNKGKEGTRQAAFPDKGGGDVVGIERHYPRRKFEDDLTSSG